MASKRVDFTINGKDNSKSVLNSASNNIKKLANDVKSTSSKMTMQSGFNKIVNEAKAATSKIKQMFTGLGGAITSVIAGFSLGSMIQDTGKIEARWNRIAAETKNSSTNITAQRTQVVELAKTYGVVTGELSEIYETNLRFFGGQQRSMRLAQGMAATEKRTGTDMKTIQQAIMSGELGRNKALQRSVLTEEQRNRVMSDGKVTQEEIAQIMEENIKFVEENKALTEDQEASWNRMMNSINKAALSIGQSIGPVVEKIAGWLSIAADAFSAINKASGGVLGTVVALGLAVVAIGAPLAWAGTMLSGMAKSAWSTASGLAAAGRSSSTIRGNPAPGRGGSVVSGGGKSALAQDVGVMAVAITLINGLNSAWTNLNYSIGQTDDWLVQAQTALMGFVDNVSPILMVAHALTRVSSSAADVHRRVQSSTAGMYASFHRFTSGITGLATSAFSRIRGAWNSLRSLISGGIHTAISIGTSAIDWARAKYNDLANFVSNNPIVQTVKTVASTVGGWLGFGPGRGSARGPGNISQARGPFDGMSLNYENYAGPKKSPFVNGGMSGNCVDMSMGLISAAGSGHLVQGTWNGGPHVWANIGGKDYDPARKALHNTWSPPARGPGDGGMGLTLDLRGAVIYDGPKFEQAVNNILNKHLG